MALIYAKNTPIGLKANLTVLVATKTAKKIALNVSCRSVCVLVLHLIAKGVNLHSDEMRV